MSRSSTRDLIADAFARWEAGEFSAVTDLMADDLQWHIIGSTPISGTFASRAEFQAVVARLLERLDGPLQVSVRRMTADGDRVAVEFDSVAPVKAGGEYAQSYCWVLQVADGRIRSGTAYLDTALIDRVLG